MNQCKHAPTYTCRQQSIEHKYLFTFFRGCQSQLPANGAPLLPKAMTTKTLADMFHDHVIASTHDNWRYWVFVSIMGHFVHSFDQQVSASTFEELQTTSLEYIGNNMSLQQLRKGMLLL